MKLLVIARRLHIDRSSEGICSSKFVLALVRGGFDLVCLTRDDVTPDPSNGKPFQISWLPGVRLVHTESLAPARSIAERAHAWAGARPLLAGAARKADTALLYASGYRLETHRHIRIWETAVAALIERERPDAIIVRGEGTSFDPHLAVMRLRPRIPWIAHYHDPYPSSLYPEPFRTVLPMASRAQERGHRGIVEHCDALTFPSQRMLQWVLQGPLERHRDKAFVLPHLASTLPAPPAAVTATRIPPDQFTLVHTGALLGPRSPVALIKAFRQFLARDPERRQRAQLIFAGPVHRAHSGQADGAALMDDPNITCIDERMRYHESLALARHATVNVVIEATGAAASPFLPAKFADYVGVGRPILALSPRESSCADALGADSPLVVPPDAPDRIEAALTLLWQSWKNGTLGERRPSEALRHALSEAAVIDELKRALHHVGAGAVRNAPDQPLPQSRLAARGRPRAGDCA